MKFANEHSRASCGFLRAIGSRTAREQRRGSDGSRLSFDRRGGGRVLSVAREDPAPADFTGRMYAPQEDMIKPGLRGGLVATTRRHVIYCARDGRIAIRHRADHVTVLRKADKAK